MNRKQPIAPYTETIKGASAMYSFHACFPLMFPVKVLDARKVYGRVDCLIEPIGGSGSKWVSADQLTEVKLVEHWHPMKD